MTQRFYEGYIEIKKNQFRCSKCHHETYDCDVCECQFSEGEKIYCEPEAKYIRHYCKECYEKETNQGKGDVNGR